MLTCQSSDAICYLSIVVAFGHKELWRSTTANRVSVISQMLWTSAITNSGSRRPHKWLVSIDICAVSWLKTRQLATLRQFQSLPQGNRAPDNDEIITRLTLGTHKQYTHSIR